MKAEDQQRKPLSWYIKRNLGHVDEYLKTHPCVDCGESDIVVLGFDPNNNMVQYRIWNGSSIKEIDRVINESAVRCANCSKRAIAKNRNTAV